METLKDKIFNLYDLSKSYTLKEYNNLIHECTKRYEMAAVVFLYDNMKHHKISPDKQTYEIINKLHSKKCKENNNIYITSQNDGKLSPRRRIHKIMKGYNYTDNYQNALKHIDLVKSYIILNPEIKRYNKIKLAKTLSTNCNIKFDDARYIITNLKRTKFLIDRNTNQQKCITDFFS
jgi:hypothetical protein